MQRLASLCITFWAGSLWTICGVVAPSLFAELEDRHTAGRLAAYLFQLEAFIGLAMGLVLLAVGMKATNPLGTQRARLLICVTAAMPLISQFALGPVMDRARAAGDMARFGMLHGAAAVLFLIACISALLLVWQFNRPAE